MSNAQSVVEFYDERGEIVAYRKLSARLPEFLAQYGPQQGYAVITEIQDSLSLKPGLLRLYEAAIRAGHKPEELGLPKPASAGLTQVCRATLVDDSGRVVASATAAKPILDYKDLEVLETAARQRLLAALGFGGEVFDADEDLDRDDQDLAPVAVPPAPAPAAGGGTLPALQPVPPAAPTQAETEPVEPISGDAPAEPAPPAAPVRDAPAATNAGEEAALALHRCQIAHLARMQGVEPPAVSTKAEAQAVLKQLLQPKGVAS